MNNIELKKEPHKQLTYAIDSNNRLVHIDEVSTGLQCGCICPACKEPLVAKNNGKFRVHHFAHQFESECTGAYETMLHLLAKERIQSAFLNSETFWLEFEYHSYCPNDNKCKYNKTKCFTKERKRFNLKEFYDRCEQEISYDGINRRSDLKLFSSTNPQRSPVYIEFCVTHASEHEKLHSGNKIIECIIEDESDINRIMEDGFVEDSPVDVFSFEPIHRRIQIYGFVNMDYKNDNISSEIEFSRYILFKSGKTRCYQDCCHCKDLKRASPYSIYEVCFHTSIAFGIYEYAKYRGYDKFHIPNCLLCRNYVDRYYGAGKICKLYKRLNISIFEQFDTSRARNCHYFKLNQDEYEEAMKYGGNTPFDEF